MQTDTQRVRRNICSSRSEGDSWTLLPWLVSLFFLSVEFWLCAEISSRAWRIEIRFSAAEEAKITQIYNEPVMWQQPVALEGCRHSQENAEWGREVTKTGDIRHRHSPSLSAAERRDDACRGISLSVSGLTSRWRWGTASGECRVSSVSSAYKRSFSSKLVQILWSWPNNVSAKT